MDMEEVSTWSDILGMRQPIEKLVMHSIELKHSYGLENKKRQQLCVKDKAGANLYSLYRPGQLTQAFKDKFNLQKKDLDTMDGGDLDWNAAFQSDHSEDL